MTADRFQELVQEVLRIGPDGQRLFSNDEVTHFLPWAMITMSVDVTSLGDTALTFFNMACQRAEVTTDMDGAQMSAALQAYYAKNPPRAELVATFERAFRDSIASGAPSANPMAALTGTKESAAPLGGTGPRPKGSIAAGPLARFKTTTKR
jgi:hypothetical protein